MLIEFFCLCVSISKLLDNLPTRYRYFNCNHGDFVASYTRAWIQINADPKWFCRQIGASVSKGHCPSAYHISYWPCADPIQGLFAPKVSTLPVNHDDSIRRAIYLKHVKDSRVKHYHVG